MYKIFFKRIIDLVLGLCALPFFLIFYLVVGAAIKLEDEGPVFYCGQRLGKDLKQYKMYKFRSMVVNAPDIRNKDGSTFNSKYDDRLTRVGRVIRELSIDEVPQIINVLRGNMSFIGPRPSPSGNEKLYSEDYLRKFSIKPGITGFNQAYFRNSVSVEERKKNDLYYVDNISFALDFKIFIKTISIVIRREGIYSNQSLGNADENKGQLNV